MMWNIFAKYFQKHLKNQMILICIAIEIVVLIIFALGIELEFIDGNLVGMSGVFSKKMIYDSVFVKSFVDFVSSMLFYVLIFLYIVGGAEFPVNLMNDSLLGIILVRGVTRRGIYISRFLGLILAYTLNAFVFSLLFSFIIFYKSDFKVFNLGPLYIFISFALTFIVIELFISFIGVLSKNSLVSSAFGILAYFVISPFLYDNKNVSLLASIFYYVVSSAYAVNKEFTNLIHGGDFNLFNFIVHIFVSIVYFVIGIEVFNRKEM
jgi:ABC-type transport system involved in multi-copper enzyme maturation permease subunit